MSAAIHDLSKLSKRESEILALASKGLLDKEISRELGVSPNTLRTYWTRIRSKAGEASRTGLAMAWVTQNMQPAVEEAPTPIDLDEYAWESDELHDTAILSDRLNELLGLPTRQYYPMDTYRRLVHPDDLARKIKLIDQTKELGARSISFTERYLLPEGVMYVHSFGEVFYRNGVCTKIRGHSVLSQPSQVLPMVQFGRWSFMPSTEDLMLDDECRRMLGVVEGSVPNFREIKGRVAHKDLEHFQSLFDKDSHGVSNIAAGCFRIQHLDGEFVHVRGVSRHAEEGGPEIHGSFVATL